MSHIVGAVLAGGSARRFGSDKALALVNGKPLIEHAADALRRHADSVIIVGREYPGAECVPDLPRPGQGPLGGICGALMHASATGAQSVMTVPCDVPFPPESLFEALAQPSCWCEDHPVFGHWRTGIAERLFEWMTFREERSVRAFAVEAGASPIRSPKPIRDVDTPEDMEQL
ncbi:molybdenum cofactor guanylyltransferase [Stakelama marina]|uniref:molybdenum cofactor guanylyltransferase n=1 Tax=Stakelama marina TaxID=2826939 RepID=UPI0024C3158A|nr:molybdenum cofactor guanylyltransferase [Stakelama marina]